MKNIFTFFGIILGIAFALDSTAQCDLSNGLIHQYMFNGNVSDSVGNAHGTLNGSLSVIYEPDQIGNTNESIHLVTRNTSISVVPISVGTNFSISFWCAKGSNAMVPTANYAKIGTYYDSVSMMEKSIGILGDIPGGAYEAEVGVLGYSGTTPTPIYLSGGTASNSNSVWQLYTFVKKGDSVTVYKDATELGTVFSADTVTQINRLFSSKTSGWGNISGKFDDYRIYNKALTTAEVEKIYSDKGAFEITQDLSAINLCPQNTNMKLSVVAPGAVNFKWYKNGSLLRQGSISEILFEHPLPSDSGAYQVVAINPCGRMDTSSTVQVTLGTQDLPDSLVSFHPTARDAGSPSGAIGNLGLSYLNGFTQNVPNRFGSGHVAQQINHLNSAIVLQNQFADPTSTFSFWFKYNSTHYGGVRAMLGSTNYNYIPVVTYQAKVGIKNGGSHYFSTNPVFTNNGWYHIVMRRDGGNLKIYVNNELVFNRDNVATQDTYPIKSIGNQISGTSYTDAALGVYDDIRTYSVPLNEEEITRLYSEIVMRYEIKRTGNLSGFSFCQGDDAELICSAGSSNDELPLDIQWYKDGVALVNSTHITGAREALLKIKNFTAADAGAYQCKFNVGCLQKESAVRNVTYNSTLAPTVTTSVTHPVCSGANGTVNINLSGTAGPTPTTKYIYYNNGLVTSPHTAAPGFHTYRVVDTINTCIATRTVQVMSPGNPTGIYDEFGSADCPSFASFVPANSCGAVTGTNWQHITNSNGKVVVSINPNGQNLGNVNVALFNERTNVAAINANNNLSLFNPKYMHKSWAIIAANTFTSPVNVRFYYTKEDLENMKAAVGCANCYERDFIMSHISGNNIDCDPTNTIPTNANLYWNKNVQDSVGENARIQSHVSGTLNNLHHNILLTTAGGSNSFGKDFNGYYFEIAADQFSEFRMHMLSSTPLPVNWKLFTAKIENKAVKLEWSVTNEETASHYEIERSRDNNSWKYVASQDKKLNGLLENSYEHYDNPQQNGQWFYRIKQFDLDGNITYSDTRMIKYRGSEFSIYPNPATQEVNIGFDDKNLQVKIYDLSGKTIISESTNKVNVSSLTTGMYFLEAIKNGQSYKTKFIKK